MNDAIALLLSLQSRGAKFWVEDRHIRCQSPKGAILPEEMERLRSLRREIMELLRGGQSIWSVPLRRRCVEASAAIPVAPTQLHPLFQPRRPHARHIAFGFRISGPLVFEALRTSIDLLVRRHEALRTTIVPAAGSLMQHVDAAPNSRLALVDMTGIGSAGCDALGELQRRIQEFVDQEIDPASGPLFEARVFRLADDEHVFVVSMDHLICDATSVDIFMEELSILYSNATGARERELPPTPLQLGDYAAWLDQIHPLWNVLHAPHWQRRLRDAPGIRWPREPDAARRQNSRYASQDISLTEDLTSQLSEFAKREQTTPAFALLATYVSVVSRWCNQTDLTVAVTDRGRDHPLLAGVFGAIAATLLLRLELTKGQGFRDLLRLVRTEFDLALEHRDFGWVASSLCPHVREEFVFNWVSVPADQGSVADKLAPTRMEPVLVSISNAAVDRNILTADVPMVLWVVFRNIGRRIFGTLFFRCDLFTLETIERLSRELQDRLQRLIRQPSLPYL